MSEVPLYVMALRLRGFGVYIPKRCARRQIVGEVLNQRDVRRGAPEAHHAARRILPVRHAGFCRCCAPAAAAREKRLDESEGRGPGGGEWEGVSDGCARGGRGGLVLYRNGVG